MMLLYMLNIFFFSISLSLLASITFNNSLFSSSEYPIKCDMTSFSVFGVGTPSSSAGILSLLYFCI